MGKSEIIWCFKNHWLEKKKCAQAVTTNGFALNHNKILHIYFFCVKRQAKNNFLEDVESTVVYNPMYLGIYHHENTHIHVYSFDPLKPHFYIVKMEFTGVYIIFLILLKT